MRINQSYLLVAKFMEISVGVAIALLSLGHKYVRDFSLTLSFRSWSSYLKWRDSDNKDRV
jgi:hypothetical protein